MRNYWRKLKLFFGIVWREDSFGDPVTIRTAWEVAGIMHGEN